MKRFAEQFNKKASGIRLSAAERRDLKERLEAYMEYHPLPAEMRPTKAPLTTESNLVSEPFLAFNFDMTILRSFAGVFVLILIVVIPMMAEQSVPGDVLYPVKVQFNEEVRSSLAISPYAQVEWETERLERRLAEARLLDSEGKLTEEVEAGVAEAVKEHSDKAKASIAKIRETDEDEAAIAEIAFASALAVQSEVLEGHVEKEDATEGEVSHSMAAIVSAVSKEQQAAEATQVGVKLSYPKLLGRVENETTKAYELFASVSEYASSEEVANIERRLADIERKLSKAIVLYEGQSAGINESVSEELSEVVEEDTDGVLLTDQTESENSANEAVVEPEEGVEGSEEQVEEVSDTEDKMSDDEENDVEPIASESESRPAEVEIDLASLEANEAAAIELLREVLVDTKKLISFMTNIDVRNNVSIDELLPVTLTDDEKIRNIKDTLTEVERLQIDLDDKEVEGNMYAKFTLAYEKMLLNIEAANTAMQSGDLESAKKTADEALLIAQDLSLLLTNSESGSISSEEVTTEEIVTDEEVEEFDESADANIVNEDLSE